MKQLLDRPIRQTYRTQSHERRGKHRGPRRLRAVTIGIGVLATDTVQPDHVILLADTMGSYDDAFSTDSLNKVLLAPEEKPYAVCANSVEEAGTQFEVIIRDLMNAGETYSDRRQVIRRAVDWYRRHHFCLEGPHGYPVGTFPEDFKESELPPPLLKKWKKHSIGGELLLASFDNHRRATLFYLNGRGGVEEAIQSAHMTVGSGGDNAAFWMGYRNVKMGMPVRRAAYCAFEAKIMAERSPKVNDRFDMIIANADGYSYQSDTNQTQGNLVPPITLAELRELFKKYGPQDIGAIT